jgi:hypothetical protein
MPLPADFFELAFQERPSLHYANKEWKTNSDRYEAHRDEGK